MRMKLRLGDRELNSNIILAPWRSNRSAFQAFCHEQGAGMAVTEMVSAKSHFYIKIRIQRADGGGPGRGACGSAAFGSDPEIMAEIAAQIEDGPFAAIDVNMGCPVPKIVNNGEGSALIRI